MSERVHEMLDLRRYPPTPDDLADRFRIAGRDIALAMQRSEEQYGLVTLISSFVMLGDILTAFGVTEAQLVELARQSARIQLSASPVLH
jgi:hypothetical protein